ncbi:MAG: type II toxin-antitoxin system VapC family toxin [Proteobacteria bacterium]|nr:type II toxin-antitoxin system VapC family toxin [Pseudomonadota bacterium]
MLILDTHVLVWLDEGNPRLGKTALHAINESLATGQLGVATISFWEVAMLIEKQRVTMRPELADWRFELLQAGLLEIPLGGATAIRAAQLPLFHGDPAGRMIVATAIENGATLMTADEKILSWKQLNQKIDARL